MYIHLDKDKYFMWQSSFFKNNLDMLSIRNTYA